MKRLKIAILSLALCFVFADVSMANAHIHTVNEGESLWSIGSDYGVAPEDIQELNGKPDETLHVGEKLELPSSLAATSEEKDLLSRLIHAEAKGEPYEGKVAVGAVILNRVADDQFPDSIHEVIHEVSPSGHYQFSPVLDGTIHEPADEESKEAAREALTTDGEGHEALFFYNPETADNHWNATQEELKVIGNHVFSR
ncbi:cell wall hydrolase [Salicibibacter kimchii]|uniref:LysM peptidoglycan-binding domain-containing protein n=1 Tax=Salicibibacter kimchii TaxID=2099786 RepID=A0A345C2A2_9BACI|nr:cell wall hydrolase [Salicibibacter kimchii]AXF57333.1 LysM peptidoglycan-binding domain-containing protein [Salicibibacter kimchii]